MASSRMAENFSTSDCRSSRKRHHSHLLFLFLLRSNFASRLWPCGMDLLPQLFEGSFHMSRDKDQGIRNFEGGCEHVFGSSCGEDPLHPQNNRKNELQRYYVQARDHSTKKALLPPQSHFPLILVLAYFEDK